MRYISAIQAAHLGARRPRSPPWLKDDMAEIKYRYQTVEFGDLDIHVRTLRDNQQFDDSDGRAAAMGISSAMWPIFGMLWDSGRILASLMLDYDIEGKRILECGCGIGLASLVLNHRGADITATDHHPRAEEFLQFNAALNDGPPIPFVQADWTVEKDSLGTFDLIIGSDLLYERTHADALSGFINRHARQKCTVIVVDPGRGHRGRFAQLMQEYGFSAHREKSNERWDTDDAYHGQILTFERT